jgi:hypothetical protein
MLCPNCKKHEVAKTARLKHLKINLCGDCWREAQFQVDGALPVIWVGNEDLETWLADEYQDERKKICKTSEDYARLANLIADKFFEYQGGEQLRDLTQEAYEVLSRDKEMLKISRMPRKNLPLLIGHIKFKENEKLFNKRLKGEV